MRSEFGAEDDDRSWLALWDLYPQLVARARASGAGDDAEDVASTLLVRIASRVDWPFDVSWPYLAQALRHELIDRHRRLVRERDLAARLVDIQRADASVEEEALSAVEARRLMETIRATQSKRTLAMLRARIVGMSWPEVASLFDSPTPAVQARVRRALIRIRRVLLAEEKVA